VGGGRGEEREENRVWKINEIALDLRKENP
jgi:hypothetical protein